MDISCLICVIGAYVYVFMYVIVYVWVYMYVCIRLVCVPVFVYHRACVVACSSISDPFV